MPPSRREFLVTLAAGGVASLVARRAGATPPAPPAAVSAAAAVRSLPPWPAADGAALRAVSWWLEWDDLAWPDAAVADRFRRRADACARSGADTAIIFGTHLRWDFLPLWDRVHELIHFVADELHARGLRLFDHHSAVVTHRPRPGAAAQEALARNRHHVPFYPSAEAAATWAFNGSRLNDWRMIDVATGEPAYLPTYAAEEFCPNNPAFRAAYAAYVRRLGAATGIDGLMCDDGIYYPRWRACGCAHCRERFQRECGRELPPVSDLRFWGNWDSDAFLDWIDLRFRTTGDFLAHVRGALPPDFPLMSCCSGSDGQTMPSVGLSYEEFLRGGANVVMLEMTGSTPALDGTWSERVPGELLHVGLGRAHSAPVLGLGYAHSADAAFLVWALNKFLGTGCWFSTLKGRLTGDAAALRALPDDAELVAEGFRWERDHPALFAGATDADVAVLFSRDTRDHYAQFHEDYVRDFHAACRALLVANVDFSVVTTPPAGRTGAVLVLASVACLAPTTRLALADFLAGGGTIITTGPTGHRDGRGRRSVEPWLAQFGLNPDVIEPARAPRFPPPEGGRLPASAAMIAECRFAAQRRAVDGWMEVPVGRGTLCWRPERLHRDEIAGAVVALTRRRALPEPVRLMPVPAGWLVRPQVDGSRVLLHALPARVGVEFHAALHNAFTGERVIAALEFAPLSGSLRIHAKRPLTAVVLHSPDLPEPRAAVCVDRAASEWTVVVDGVRRYFVLECQQASE